MMKVGFARGRGAQRRGGGGARVVPGSGGPAGGVLQSPGLPYIKDPMPTRRTADIRLAVSVRADPAEVYRALTSARELCAWWLDRAETDARNMGRWRMAWGTPARGEARGLFVDLEPERKVAFMEDDGTRPKGWPPLTTFFLEKKGRATEVTVVAAGFSSPKPLAAARGRWEDCLAKLKLYLETGRARKAETLALSAK
ncbi:SRPBCC domain-containing protein [bacterium]|nr:MAG: SRPBCC domain-containing protein [bacterium]